MFQQQNLSDNQVTAVKRQNAISDQANCRNEQCQD
jgi:hypothetical protein